jgi:SAM-dependent MidA family methyltransferase
MQRRAEPDSVSSEAFPALVGQIREAIERAGGWIGFDRYMALALYAPGLGYYANPSRKFGALPGSDFITAPELTPLFGRALARQLAQALEASGSDELFEFGAGSGALAEQLLDALGGALRRYSIVDVSGSLRARQRERLAAHGERVRWLDAWPASMHGVAIGNEVLDAMPVQLLHWDGERWFERGLALGESGEDFRWSDRPTALRPPIEAPFVPGTTIELHSQAEAFVASLGERLARGAAFFIDYGFPEAEYYHPQRHMGTVMCHRGHQADTDPLADVGAKDITAHVDFTGIALAGQDAGLAVLGYTSQARFLFNAGLLPMMEEASLAERTLAARLIHEHEMGELFKVIGFAAGEGWEALGFSEGDRSHTL